MLKLRMKLFLGALIIAMTGAAGAVYASDPEQTMTMETGTSLDMCEATEQNEASEEDQADREPEPEKPSEETQQSAEETTPEQASEAQKKEEEDTPDEAIIPEINVSCEKFSWDILKKVERAKQVVWNKTTHAYDEIEAEENISYHHLRLSRRNNCCLNRVIIQNLAVAAKGSREVFQC